MTFNEKLGNFFSHNTTIANKKNRPRVWRHLLIKQETSTNLCGRRTNWPATGTVRCQTHNPLISPPCKTIRRETCFKHTRHFWALVCCELVVWGGARGRARDGWARGGVLGSARSCRGRGGWSRGARGRCVRGVRAAPPQPRLPAWKFDFSDVSSAPCFATIELHRTARHYHMNSQPLILHVHLL